MVNQYFIYRRMDKAFLELDCSTLLQECNLDKISSYIRLESTEKGIERVNNLQCSG